MKALRYALYAVAGLAALVAVALAAVATIVDGAFVKTRLERAMQARHRTLKIEGVPKLRLFPVAGIVLGRTTLSEPGSDKTFVALDSADVAVRVMPFLSGTVALETLSLAGLKVNVVRHKDGSMNFADLAGAGAGTASPRRGAPLKLKISGVDVRNAQFDYRDEAGGREIAVEGLDLEAGRLDGSEPGEVSFSAHVKGSHPDADVRLQASGKLRFDLGRQQYQVEGFRFDAQGQVDRDRLSASLSAPKVAVTPDRATGEAVIGDLSLKGPAHHVLAKLRIAAVEGNAGALSVPSLGLEVDAETEGNAVKGKVDAALKADLAARVYELPKIAAQLAIASPAIPQKKVDLPLEGSLRADLGKQVIAAQLSTRFDESRIQAKLSATRLEPLAATFDVAVDRLDLDRYLPAEREQSKTDDRVDLSGLKGKMVSGKLAIGALTVKRAKLENVVAEVKLQDGRLDVAPHSAKLYGGSLEGSLSADANGNRIHLKESAQNVALGALLHDVAQKDVLEGRGNIALDVQTAGGTVSALKKALAGSARVELKDGAVKGINLADSSRNLKSALGGKVSKADPSQKTDFSEASASFRIAGGVAHNDDLTAKSPFLRLGGAGNLDIGNNAIDYEARATLAATAKGQGGRDVGQVGGITVPVKLSGALDDPQWHVDYSALLGGAAGSVTDLGKRAAGGIKDTVRGLFKR